MDPSADSTVLLNKCICSTGFIFLWSPQNYFMEENFLFCWIHVPSSTVTINSVGSSGLAHSFMAQTDITNDYLATQSHVMTLQKPRWKLCGYIWMRVCVCAPQIPVPVLCIGFEALGAYITCLCRGPLKPKLAAIRRACSSRTPSNMSMTSCEIQWRRQWDKGMEKWSE